MQKELFSFSDQTTEDTCNCTEPCRQIEYSHSLSYAELSDVNVENYVINGPEKKVQLQVPFSVKLVLSKHSHWLVTKVVHH